MMEGPSKEERERWQAEGDIRTLTEAAKIRADKTRLKRALLYAKKAMRELEDVQDAESGE